MEGQNVRCCHCDGTGTMDGPGGPEECCHCRGKGERWFDSEADADVARADLNTVARQVDPDLDIGGGHAGMPSAQPIGRVMFWLIASVILLLALAAVLAAIFGAAKP